MRLYGAGDESGLLMRVRLGDEVIWVHGGGGRNMHKLRVMYLL